MFVSDLHNPHSKKQRKYSSQTLDHGAGDLGDVSESSDTIDEASQEEISQSSDNMEVKDDLINPFWIEDPQLGQGEVDNLSGSEISFWKALIEKYLHPIDADKVREAEVKKGLEELRNKSVTHFCIINALFVLIIFLLTLNKEDLYMNWPFNVSENITITEDDQVLFSLHNTYLNIVFILFFK